jgi:hypothetical protein
LRQQKPAEPAAIRSLEVIRGFSCASAARRAQFKTSLQGNPAMKDDWFTNPKSGEVVDFIDFARSEGRFAKQFDKEGNPSETLLYAKQDRLENWHLLQELAGLR